MHSECFALMAIQSVVENIIYTKIKFDIQLLSKKESYTCTSIGYSFYHKCKLLHFIIYIINNIQEICTILNSSKSKIQQK